VPLPMRVMATIFSKVTGLNLAGCCFFRHDSYNHATDYPFDCLCYTLTTTLTLWIGNRSRQQPRSTWPWPLFPAPSDTDTAAAYLGTSWNIRAQRPHTPRPRPSWSVSPIDRAQCRLKARERQISISPRIGTQRIDPLFPRRGDVLW
jgi:hypothetical protein